MSLDGWSDERIELLKEMRKKGVSSSAIGERLGVSRNAICGKAHRLGLSLGPKTASHRRMYELRRRVTLEQRGNPPGFGGHRLAKPKVYPIPPPQVEDVGRKTILELEERDCRYPWGDNPIQLFCGLPKEDLDPDRPHRPYTYCAGHNARSYQPPREPGNPNQNEKQRETCN